MSRRKEDHLTPVEVEVKGDNINAAITKLNKFMGAEGITQKMKEIQYFQKPSDIKRKERRDRERRLQFQKEENQQ